MVEEEYYCKLFSDLIMPKFLQWLVLQWVSLGAV